MPHPSSGVLAALITPVDEQGEPDFDKFHNVIEFVLTRGVSGVVIGGGTGEYPHLTIKDRMELTAQAVRHVKGRGFVVASIGSSSIHSTLRLARNAEEAGCDALLIPMPYFFRYEQQDLAAFAREVCKSVSLPCLLYNLPSFTNPLNVSTALDLLSSVPNLVGMKDSSGELASLQPLAEARKHRQFSLFAGDDSFLLPALKAGWDGVVSGIACFVPELIVALYQSYRAGDLEKAAEQQATLDDVIDHIVQLPIPWGVRIGLGVRGIPNGPLHLPLSDGRREQISSLKQWLTEWTERSQLKPA